MVRHIVCFRWAQGTSAEAIDAVEQALAALPAQVPAIKAFQFGRDLGLAEGNWDFSVTADLADEGAYLDYRDDEAHQAVIRDVVRPILAERVAVQITIDD